MKRTIYPYYKTCIVILSVSFMYALNTFAATVDTVDTYSASMAKQIKAVVILPETYEGSRRFPVVYLLAGVGVNHGSIPNHFPDLGSLADHFEFIFISVDGGINSWYINSPEQPESQYETYVSKELVDWIDDHYMTIPERNFRGITGFSMGGHGALHTAIKHQETFGIAGSIHGAVDLRPYPDTWNIASLLGSYDQHPDRWAEHSVYCLSERLLLGKLSLIIDCGTGDFFFNDNEKLHKKLMDLNIPHLYMTRPGVHDKRYWNESLLFHCTFFKEYFKNNDAFK